MLQRSSMAPRERGASSVVVVLVMVVLCASTYVVDAERFVAPREAPKPRLRLNAMRGSGSASQWFTSELLVGSAHQRQRLLIATNGGHSFLLDGDSCSGSENGAVVEALGISCFDASGSTSFTPATNFVSPVSVRI